jgi:hypothetical protein
MLPRLPLALSLALCFALAEDLPAATADFAAPRRMAEQIARCSGLVQAESIVRAAQGGPVGWQALLQALPTIERENLAVVAREARQQPGLRVGLRTLALDPRQAYWRAACRVLALTGEDEDLGSVLESFNDPADALFFQDIFIALAEENPAGFLMLITGARRDLRRNLLWRVAAATGHRPSLELMAAQVHTATPAALQMVCLEGLLRWFEDGPQRVLDTFGCLPLTENILELVRREAERFELLARELPPGLAEAEALWRLRFLTRTDPLAALDLVKAVLADEQHPYFAAALDAAAELPYADAALEKLLTPQLWRASGRELLLAVRACGKLGFHRTISTLARKVHSPDRELAREAVLALAALNDQRVFRFLRRALYQVRNCKIRMLIFEVLLNAGRMSEDRRPDCSHFCFCGEWGNIWCPENGEYYCREHFEAGYCRSRFPGTENRSE